MSFSKSHYLRLALMLLVAVVGALISYPMLKKKEHLPIYNPGDLSEKLVDSSLQWKRKGHTIAPFSLVDQNNNEVTQALCEGKITVVDFFFVSCQGICVDMVKNMKIVQEKFKEDSRVLILSHTVKPEEDSVQVLQDYAQKRGVNYRQWRLLTGDEEHIYDLARKSYFVVSKEQEGFIHTENFALIDTQGRIRGYYDGTNSKEVEKLVEHISILLEKDKIALAK